MKEIEIFISLVDNNAQVKSYKRLLGLSKEAIAPHMQRLALYRDVAKISKEIRELFKDRAKNFNEIKKLREQMRQIVERWKNG